VPVELGGFQWKGVSAAHPSPLAALPPHDQDHQPAEGHMQPVEAGDGIEGAGEQVVRQAEGEAEVLLHLARQEAESEGGGDQQPALAAVAIVAAQG